MTQGRPEAQKIVESCLCSGQTCILDVFHPDPVIEAKRLEFWRHYLHHEAPDHPTRCGLRLSFQNALQFLASDVPPSLGMLVLVGDKTPGRTGDVLRRCHRQGVTVFWEFSPGADCPVDSHILGGIVIRSYESGGISRDQSVRTLFSSAGARFENVPLFLQGIESPELAAVLVLMGAQGFILDASLFRLPQSGLAAGIASQLSHPSESRLRREPLGNGWVDVHYNCAEGEVRESLPVGPNIFLCDDVDAANPQELTASFVQGVNAVLGELTEVPGRELQKMAGAPFLVQGPMAWISNSVKFANQNERAGFFPVLALTGLDAEEVSELGKEVIRNKGLSSYGIGLAGPAGFDCAMLKKSFGRKPPAAVVLAADQWAFCGKWQETSWPLWLHVQTRAMLDMLLGEKQEQFILEGCESGGHVGYLPSIVLWTIMFRHIRKRCESAAGLRLVLAGGLHDAASVLFGMLLARAFSYGGRISFQLGTPLLLSREAVSSGALNKVYQEFLKKACGTKVIGSGSGTGIRVAELPGSLRGEKESVVDEAGVYRGYRLALRGKKKGLFLAGESAALLDRELPLKSIRDELMDFSAKWEECLSRLTVFETLDFGVAADRPRLDLAVVGIGGIFPGAGTVKQFWKNISENKRSIVEIPPEYWGPGNYRVEKGEEQKYEASTYTWHAGMIRDFSFDKFDCLKFHITPRSAAVADRIHLMILKAVEQAVQSASAGFVLPKEQTAVLIGNSMGGELAKRGVLRTHLPGIIAMLSGIPEFKELDARSRERIISNLKEKLLEGTPEVTEDSLVNGAASTLAGRIAGYLNLYGANFTLDAACASSMAALAVAAQQITTGKCSCAVVGAVDSDLTVDSFINFCKLHALAGRISRPFMVGSDGFTMGEGAGVIFLKPFDQALADGNRIYARVMGVGMSSDGNKGTMTMPSREGQVLAIKRAFEESGFASSSIGLIEAHGTGTEIGDSIELAVIQESFQKCNPASVVLGTVKAHIGHLKSAAGVASLAKTILALHHKVLPPAWIEGEIRPEIRKAGSPFVLLPKAKRWSRKGFLPRRAAVSSFGFGGSNFHIHLQEADEKYRLVSKSRLLMFSGRDRNEVAAKVEKVVASAAEHGWFDFYDAAQAGVMGGTGICRMAAVWPADEPWKEMLLSLKEVLAGGTSDNIWFNSRCARGKVVFLFPGQGSIVSPPFGQILETVPSFAADLKRFEQIAGLDFINQIWHSGKSLQDNLRENGPMLQAGTMSLSLALARMLMRLGVCPNAAGGHSLGLYTTLAFSGVLGEADSIRLVHQRAKCFESMGVADGGCMLVIPADREKVIDLLRESPRPFYPANFNSPVQTAISMKRADVGEIEKFLKRKGMDHQRLPVPWGFHSPLVARAGRAFEKYLAPLDFRTPFVDFYSETLGAEVASFRKKDLSWLRRQISHPVEFTKMIRNMASDGCEFFVEVGVRGALSKFVRETLGQPAGRTFTTDSTSSDIVDHLNEVLARLYVEAGVNVDLGGYRQVFGGHLRPVRITDGYFRGPATQVTMGDERPAEEKKGTGKAGSGAMASKVRAIIAKHSGFEENLITDDQLLRGTLGIDSLKMVEIALDIEKTLKVRLAEANISSDLTVGGLTELLGRLAASGNEGQQAKPDIRRYELVFRQVDIPSKAADGTESGLLTYDRKLAEAWKAKKLGPSECLGSPTENEIEGALRRLVSGKLSSLVYAAPAEITAAGEDTSAERTLKPAFVFARNILPELIAKEKKVTEIPRFLTAGFEAGSRFGESLAGFSKSLQREYPELCFGHITVTDAGELSACLPVEVQNGHNPFAFVRYADGRRLTEHLEVSSKNGTGVFPIKDSDVVLVTGGGHGITAEIILGLSRQVKPRWIITGSKDIKNGSDAAGAVKKTIERLKKLGCRVEYHCCDFSEAGNVRKLATKLKGSVTGVIHGAGIIADARMEKKSFDDFLRVVQVKAGSALALENSLDLKKLRFWINLSSIASFFGNAEQTDYAAANVFLNRQAERLGKAGIPFTRSILWSPWSGAGMAAGEQLQAVFRAKGIPVISPEQGVELMKQELARKGAPVVAFCGEPAAYVSSRRLEPDGLFEEERIAGASIVRTSRSFDLQDPFLRDHRINGIAVLPGAVMLDFSALGAPDDWAQLVWERVRFRTMVRMPEEGMKVVLRWTMEDADRVCFEGSDIRSSGAVSFEGALCGGTADAGAVKKPVAEKSMQTLKTGGLYGPGGFLFSGPVFQVLTDELKVGAATVCGQMRGSGGPMYRAGKGRMPAALVDGIFQMAAVFCHVHKLGSFLPTGVERLWWSGREVEQKDVKVVVWTVGKAGGSSVKFNAVVEDEGGTLIKMNHLVLTAASKS